MTTILTKTWIHPDEDDATSDPHALVAPLDVAEPRRLFGAAKTWTSPEGTLIICDSAAKKRVRRRRRWRRVPRWTPKIVYEMLCENGLDTIIGPNLTVRVQDVYASQASASIAGSGSTYTSFKATIWLKGVRSSFRFSPDSTVGHEYGHVWGYFHKYMTHQGDFSGYLDARGLAGDPRLNTTYPWDEDEILADDYRLLLGSEKAALQRTWHMNSDIPGPTEIPGLREFMRDTWTSP